MGRSGSGIAKQSPAEIIAAQFYGWELRGRGWIDMPYRVVLEPPFRPFHGFVLPRIQEDDGRIPTLLSRLAEWLFRRAPTREPEAAATPEGDPECFASDEPLVEFVVALPQSVGVGFPAAEGFLCSLRACRLPVAFELIAARGQLSVQVTCRTSDASLVESNLRAFFPDASASGEEGRLACLWQSAPGDTALLEFGLAREFMVPLAEHRSFDPDPLLPLFAALGTLDAAEVGIVQVLLEGAREPWAESTLRAVTDAEGKPLFVDAPEITAFARKKIAQPLFAVLLRVAGKSAERAGAWRIVRDCAGAFSGFGTPSGNELIPLSQSDEDIDLVGDLLRRESHRSGMLLGSGELVSLVHLPSSSVRMPTLRRTAVRSKSYPPSRLAGGVMLGENRHRGHAVVVRVPEEARMRHTHVVGASGSGKSTLLVQLIAQDIAAGRGVGVLDPHGDLIDEVLGRIPEERVRDVVLFDPADEGTLVGWNILAARSELEKTLLASDLVGVFRRLSTSWGDQMTSVLSNAILAFLESPTGGTLVELRQFLVDREFRTRFLSTIADEHLRFYWEREFPLLVGKPQAPILTRLDTFLRSKLVRRIVAERDSRLDLRRVVDEGRIFLGKLSQGAIGEENAALLGSLLVSKFHQVALSRQELAPEERRSFHLYIDECQHFATPSMAGLLSGARKYRLALTAAHQELHQLRARDPEVASALLSNAGTRIVFRVGEDDARQLERGFSYFAAADLVNLSVGEAICRIGRSEDDFNLTTQKLPPLRPGVAKERRDRIIIWTRDRFPAPRLVGPTAPREDARPAPPVTAASVPLIPPSPEPAPPRSEPAPLGRGGPEHQYLQELVKRWGEARGLRVMVEHFLESGGSVDVVLQRDGWSLACEISVSSTVEQEIKNVEKCLAAGFSQVALISLKKPLLAKVRTALAGRLSKEDNERVLYLSPEELASFLDSVPSAEASSATVSGYKVNVSYRPTDAAGGEAKRRAVSGVIAKSLRRVRTK
jgi:hypothetical protein